MTFGELLSLSELHLPSLQNANCDVATLAGPKALFSAWFTLLIKVWLLTLRAETLAAEQRRTTVYSRQ